MTHRQQKLPGWKRDRHTLILHRSACMVAPENTAPALEQAVKQGADGVEIDIRKTKDGHFVLYHDDWILEDFGPGGKIEDLTLAHALYLDVGKRFGPQWRGTHLPLLDDVLRFAKANDLRLYLDIKTPGIYDEVMDRIKKAALLPLVTQTGGNVPKNHYSTDLRFIPNWNYTGGGEEDPARIQESVEKMPPETFAIMADDGRAWAMALGRRPERRPCVPFAATPPRLKDEIWLRPSEAFHPEKRLITSADSGTDSSTRLAALWELGNRKAENAVAIIERIALMRLPTKVESKEFDTVFLKIGAACALARFDSSAARAALNRVLASPGNFDRAAAAIALACFGTNADIPTLVSLVAPIPKNEGVVADFVLGYAGRFGATALPIYQAALQRNGFSAKQTVFGLANLGVPALPTLRTVIYDEKTAPAARRRAALTLYWMPDSPPVRTLRMEIERNKSLPESVRLIVPGG